MIENIARLKQETEMRQNNDTLTGANVVTKQSPVEQTILELAGLVGASSPSPVRETIEPVNEQERQKNFVQEPSQNIPIVESNIAKIDPPLLEQPNTKKSAELSLSIHEQTSKKAAEQSSYD